MRLTKYGGSARLWEVQVTGTTRLVAKLVVETGEKVLDWHRNWDSHFQRYGMLSKLHSWLRTHQMQMAPHTMESILPPPQWPVALSNFVTWCLMWDPKNRPTSSQAMNHEYFSDAVDPLRPKSSTSRLLGRKHSGIDFKSQKESNEISTLSSKQSWFRKSLITRESSPAVPQHTSYNQISSPRPSPTHTNTTSESTSTIKHRPFASKRATWTNGTMPLIGAPMPILPSIRPISPLSHTLTAQAHSRLINDGTGEVSNINSAYDGKATKKIGRQLSVASTGNHYADLHRQEAERALVGNGNPVSPSNGQKEGFFSHLRKRARRLSGRHQLPLHPTSDDIEANAGGASWTIDRAPMAIDSNTMMGTASKADFTELDRALQNVRYGLEASSPSALSLQFQSQKRVPLAAAADFVPLRSNSISPGQTPRSMDHSNVSSPGFGPISSRTRRTLHASTHPTHRYETPDEEDELLDEAVNGARRAAKGMDSKKTVEEESCRTALARKDSNRQTMQYSVNSSTSQNPYPTPSPSAKRNGILFSQSLMDEPTTPLNITKSRANEESHQPWPTPPYEENEWAASAAASIFAAGAAF